MQDTSDRTEPDERSVRVIVTDLRGERAFGFTTPEGEAVCVVDRTVLANRSHARDSAYKTLSALLTQGG